MSDTSFRPQRTTLGRTRLELALVQVRTQWRQVVLPTLFLWVLGVCVAGPLIHSLDVSLYERYAHRALQTPLFHRFPLEYPPTALAVFILPLVLPFSYQWAFAIFAGAILLALVMSYETSGVPGINLDAARRLIVYITLGAVVVVTARYDIFAAAAAFWSLRAARQNRWSAAWSWACIGFMLKLFPAALWPVLIVGEWQNTRRVPILRLVWIAGSLTLIAGIPALLNAGSVDNAVRYYINRPPEVGSLAAGLSLLINWSSSHFAISFNSTNEFNSAVGPLSNIIVVLSLIGCVLTWIAQAKGKLSIEAAALTTLTLVILGGKVFSVQYLLWVMPFWALYRHRTSWLIASVLNTLVFPFSVFAETARFHMVATRSYWSTLTFTYLLRDLLILFGTIAWLRSSAGDLIFGETVAAAEVRNECRSGCQRHNPP
jgi:hypothetical protein